MSIDERFASHLTRHLARVEREIVDWKRRINKYKSLGQSPPQHIIDRLEELRADAVIIRKQMEKNR